MSNNCLGLIFQGLLNQAGRRKRQASITTCSSFITNVNALLNAIEKGLDSWSLLAIEFMSLEVSDIGSCSATDGQNLLDTQLNLNILQLKVEYSLAATTPGTTAAAPGTNAPVTSTAPSSAAPSTTDISTTKLVLLQLLEPLQLLLLMPDNSIRNC